MMHGQKNIKLRNVFSSLVNIVRMPACSCPSAPLT